MNPTAVARSEPYNNFSEASPRRKGSVKRARELLEAGVRSTVSPPAQVVRPSANDISHQTTWPLPASGLQLRPLNPQARSQLQISRGPLPQRPPRPVDVASNIPSPSIYSVPSGDESAVSISHAVHPVRSFSLPRPSQLPLRPATGGSSIASPTSTPDMTPRISVITDDLFRQSTVSSTSSAIDLPSIPLPNPQESSGLPTGGIGASPNTRGTQARRSSVSPIPEELVGSRQTLASIASSRAIPSSWESGLPESAIAGAYLDDDSGDDEHYQHEPKVEDAALVRNASIGKRGKPTMRTILKSNPSSEVTLDNAPTSTFQSESKEVALTRSSAVGIATMRVSQTSNPARRMSTSTISDESFVDPEKPRFAKHDKPVYSSPLEKELEVLPKANPTLSDKRPGARKPPALNLNAVREAEARGSLSSLTDLIRRATRLASNLDHGKTASRADFAGIEADFRELGKRGHGSGSLSDILASFPNPSLFTPETRGSWPVFLGRSNLRNVESLHSNEDGPNTKEGPRRCCGMPRKWFILLCILLFIIVLLAILLPVLLVAKSTGNANDSSCATMHPCYNGGVSVSSVSECSCVCSNGYIGSQCTVSGDSSCVTSSIDNGTITNRATMGSSLPRLFNQSQPKFSIELDPVTIMALFSINNVSCMTENALVSFSNVDSASTTGTTTGKNSTSAVSSGLVKFSQVVVLYILQKTGSLDTAMASQSQIAGYLTGFDEDTSHPSLDVGVFDVNFAKKTISVHKGTD